MIFNYLKMTNQFAGDAHRVYLGHLNKPINLPKLAFVDDLELVTNSENNSTKH